MLGQPGHGDSESVICSEGRTPQLGLVEADQLVVDAERGPQVRGGELGENGPHVARVRCFGSQPSAKTALTIGGTATPACEAASSTLGCPGPVSSQMSVKPRCVIPSRIASRFGVGSAAYAASTRGSRAMTSAEPAMRSEGFRVAPLAGRGGVVGSTKEPPTGNGTRRSS